MDRVYLDYNATAPLRPTVIEAVTAAMRDFGNPSSIHFIGRRARKLLDDAREAVAALVNAKPANVFFTSGGTEANALAILGSERKHVLVSAVEHGSVRYARSDANLIPVTPDGVVSPAALEACLAGIDGTQTLISIMAANNETGVIQPIAELSAIAHRHGALFHTDAIQMAGKLPVDMAAWDVDILTLSAHKIGGPQGVGAVAVRDQDVDLTPLLRGGGQEFGRRAGTQNVPGLAGFGVAAQLAVAGLQDFARLATLRDALEDRLLTETADARILARETARLPNTSAVMLPGLAAQTQVMGFDLHGIAVSAGAACSSGKIAPSSVLKAMGLSEIDAGSAIRISLGWNSQASDIDKFIEAWRDIAAHRGGCLHLAATA